MMHSMLGGGSGDDDDDDDAFGPNPFRSGGDLLGTPNPPQQQQQQQQNFQPQQTNIPDPNSGMTGSFVLPSPPVVQQQHPPQYLQGTMDQKVNSNSSNNYGSNGETPPTGGIFSLSFWTRCCRVDRYAQYFDMDTRDIQERLLASVLHFYKPDYFRCHIIGSADEQEQASMTTATMSDSTSPLNRKGPDLYGPVWLSMTLVFLLGVTSNMAAWYHFQRTHHQSTAPSSGTGNSTTAPSYNSEQEEERFENDMTHIVRALSVVMIFAWVMPTIFWLATTCLGMSQSSPSWVNWICCYGYSLTAYCLLVPLAWLPGIVSLVLIAAATFASCLLVLRNLSTPLLQASDHGKAAPVILAIPAAHVIFGCVLEWTFYAGFKK